METIQINMNAPQRAIREIHPTNMVIEEGELLITLKNRECYYIDAGQTLIFKRYIYKEDGSVLPLIAMSKILYEDVLHVIHASIPYWDKYRVLSYEKKDDYFILTTNGHNIFAQDINNKQELYLDYVIGVSSYTETISLENFTIPNKYSFSGVTKNECLTSKETIDTCDILSPCRSITTYYYSFLPNSFSTNKIIVKGVDEEKIKATKYLRTKFNPFYYYYEESGVIKCVLYGDPWWDEFKSSETLCTKYVNNGDTTTIIGVDDAYWNVGIGLSMGSNEDALGSEETFSTNLVSDVEDSIIPDTIDMERVKYSPITTNGSAVTSITLDFHFKERMENQGDNTEQTKDNYYADGWYINPDSAATTWWNGMKSTATTIDSGKMTEFINNSGKTSDLLGLLNFTDTDVYYRKKKVSQSFVRFSFYSKKNETTPLTSTVEEINPLNERLLYYSTVFFDGGKLYGKYIKQLINIENATAKIPYAKTPTNNTNVVFCVTSARVDSEIVITNEFDRTSSAEGFNIYLFKDDAPTKENPEKTIYMKVEFNHAGNGKTMPMILAGMWPKEGNAYKSLTINNYFKSLYIPIKLKYINDKYYYSIEKAEDNGNLRLVLLEPKLDN